VIILDDRTVDESEIDHLGHMSVRFYARRALRAAEALLDRAGLSSPDLKSKRLKVVLKDAFNHFFNEQHLGAHLAAMGGWMEHGPRPRAYIELVNQDDGARAASFLVEPALVAAETPHRLTAPTLAAPDQLVAVPDYALPRSISLAPPELDIDITRLEALAAGWAMPHGLGEAVVPADACDEHGLLNVATSQDASFVVIDLVGQTHGHMIEAEGSAPFGWAMLEQRQHLLGVPRVGERVRTVSVQTRIGDKTLLSRRWTYNAVTRELYGMIDGISLAFDPVRRKSMTIPDQVRAELQAQCFPELMAFRAG